MSINLSNIKTQFKTIFDAANTTTAAYDLSAGMSTRVRRVLKVDPSRIPPQASFVPWVTCKINQKSISHATIAKDQITGKRVGEISMSVIGCVWEQILNTVDDDPADENCEKLMENCEEIIRRNFKLNGTVDWSKATEASYHTLPIDEQTHMRVGVLTLVCRVQY